MTWATRIPAAIAELYEWECQLDQAYLQTSKDPITPTEVALAKAL